MAGRESAESSSDNNANTLADAGVEIPKKTHSSPTKSASESTPETSGFCAESDQFSQSALPAPLDLSANGNGKLSESAEFVEKANETEGEKSEPDKEYLYTERPPFSFISLITMAILQSPEEKLTLRGICDYIRKKFPYYNERYPKWEPSIRHNLSLNECFVKANREDGDAGRGCYWSMHPDSENMYDDGSFRRRRQRFSTRKSNSERKSATAAKSVQNPYGRPYGPPFSDTSVSKPGTSCSLTSFESSSNPPNRSSNHDVQENVRGQDITFPTTTGMHSAFSNRIGYQASNLYFNTVGNFQPLACSEDPWQARSYLGQVPYLSPMPDPYLQRQPLLPLHPISPCYPSQSFGFSGFSTLQPPDDPQNWSLQRFFAPTVDPQPFTSSFSHEPSQSSTGSTSNLNFSIENILRK